MKRIHYKSDFDFFLDLVDEAGQRVDPTECDWVARFHTFSTGNVFEASYRGGEFTNCFLDGGRLHIVCDNHGLLPGAVRVELTAELPNAIYPDGHRRVVKAKPLDIQLVAGEDDSPTAIEIEHTMPFIKGKDGLNGQDGRDGASAYALATASGYSGTEAQFSQDLSEIGNVLHFEPTDGVVEAIEPGIVTDALRMTPQKLTVDEQAQVKKNLNISKLELFVDLVNAAVGDYGHAWIKNTGEFEAELNGVTNITYEQMCEIMLAGVPKGNYLTPYFYNFKPIRTNLPMLYKDQMFSGAASTALFRSCSSLEVAQFIGHIGAETFCHCRKLREIKGNIAGTQNCTYAFLNCVALENIERFNMGHCYNISFAQSPLLNIGTFERMIASTSALSARILTVHPDVMAKIEDESNTEWHSLLELAASKNIQFAS